MANFRALKFTSNGFIFSSFRIPPLMLPFPFFHQMCLNIVHKFTACMRRALSFSLSLSFVMRLCIRVRLRMPLSFWTSIFNFMKQYIDWFFFHSLKHCVALRIKCANDDVNYYQQQQQQQQQKRRWRQQSQQQCIQWDLITYWRVVYLHGQDKLVKAANGKIDQKPKWKRVSKQQRNHKFSPAANAKGRWIVNTWLNRTNKPKYRPMENE